MRDERQSRKYCWFETRTAKLSYLSNFTWAQILNIQIVGYQIFRGYHIALHKKYIFHKSYQKTKPGSWKICTSIHIITVSLGTSTHVTLPRWNQTPNYLYCMMEQLMTTTAPKCFAAKQVRQVLRNLKKHLRSLYSVVMLPF